MAGVSYSARNIARAFAKATYRAALTRGQYESKFDSAGWYGRYDAETNKVHVTNKFGRTFSFKPANSWAGI